MPDIYLYVLRKSLINNSKKSPLYRSIDLCYYLFSKSVQVSTQQNMKANKNYSSHRQKVKTNHWNICGVNKNCFKYLKLANPFYLVRRNHMLGKLSV